MLRFLPLIALAGCAALKPVGVPVYAEHVSHITQHEPFCSHPTNYGWEEIGIGLHWNVKGADLTLTDGHTFNSVQYQHEIFRARVSYEFQIK